MATSKVTLVIRKRATLEKVAKS